MLRWSKAMPRLQIERQRSPSDDFRKAKLGAAPDALGSAATERAVGRPGSSEIQERNARIRERVANNEPVEKIAKDEVLSGIRVYQICKGVKRKGKPPRKPRARNPEIEERNAKIRERYANGETLAIIGSDYGIRRQGVSVICKGIERKAGKYLRGSELKKRNAMIRGRFANGEAPSAIGEDYDLTQERIRTICKGIERKVKPPRKPRARNPEIKERNAK